MASQLEQEASVSVYRNRLPQLEGSLFLSDGGLETALVHHEGLTLPCFAAFTLLESEAGLKLLWNYFVRHVEIARDHGMGFILDTPTWRASSNWSAKLSVSERRLDRIHQMAVELAKHIRHVHEAAGTPIVINGVIGPRDGGWSPDRVMQAGKACHYHGTQMQSFARTAVDMVSAMTMTHVGEAVGLGMAARDCGLPIAISFTTRDDGRLPTGQKLGEAIVETDHALDGYPVYYLVNCAHPGHFAGELWSGGSWVQRVRGVRAHAVRCGHVGFETATELDDGDPDELAEEYMALRKHLPWMNVLGGCCGTDERHLEAIALRLRAR